MSGSNRRRLIGGLLFVFALALHAPSSNHRYVYDDERFVERNPAVRDGASLGSYFSDIQTFAANRDNRGAWRPLRTLTWRAVAIAAGPPPS